MKVVIIINVEYDAATTQFTAEQHAARVEANVAHAVGDGLLTMHEPEAELVAYAVSATAE